jgi:hypothetical protein
MTHQNIKGSPSNRNNNNKDSAKRRYVLFCNSEISSPTITSFSSAAILSQRLTMEHYLLVHYAAKQMKVLMKVKSEL